jgi:putative tricarboxylic transport membrane protein
MGGKVTAGVSGYGEFEGQIKTGKLRILAVTSPKRIEGVDAPTLKEQGIDLDIANWRSVMGAPASRRRSATRSSRRSKPW